MINYKEKSELAYKILENSTQYLREKSLIHDFFVDNDSVLTEGKIMTQLTIIDSYYSTNMSHRYYGIEEVKDAIIKLSTSQTDLRRKFIEYAFNPTNHEDITDLFHAEYGYSKKGFKFGQAISLISKYAYFITDFQFPIFDSIVREIYPLIQKHQKLSNNRVDAFVLQINDLMKLTEIEDYNKLDNLLWLIGKINRGNYSLILNKQKYLDLISKVAGLEYLKSDKIDDKIKYFIHENIDHLPAIFNSDMMEMIKFTYTLINNKKSNFA